VRPLGPLRRVARRPVAWRQRVLRIVSENSRPSIAISFAPGASPARAAGESGITSAEPSAVADAEPERPAVVVDSASASSASK
jgi:hypothetical protein